MGFIMSSYRFGILILACSGFLPLALGLCTKGASPFNLNSWSGSIKSTGYPEYYYGNERCDWNLNPPRGRVPELLIVDLIKVDTNIDDAPEEENYCFRAKNFLNVGPVRACGEEGPVCLAILLKYSPNLDCHRKILNDYPACHSLVHTNWPIDISFQTDEADFNKAGFNLNYTFVDCSAPSATTTTESPDEILSSTTTGISGTSSSRTTSTPPITPTHRTTTTTIRTSSTEKRTQQTVKTQMTTTISTTVSKKIAKDKLEQPEKDDNTNMILIITLVILLVIFLFVVVAVIFRKRIRAWVTERKDAKQLNGSPNREAPQYTEAYIIPIDGKHTYERPLPAAETVPNGDANGNKYDKLNEFTTEQSNEGVVISNGKVTENVHYESIKT